MTDAQAHFSDEELTAYLDEQAEHELRVRIATALREDASLRARLDALDVPLAALKDGMDQLSALAPAAPPLERPFRPAGALPLAASLALGLALGAGAMALLQDRRAEPRQWQDYAAAYHLLYRTETLASVAPQQDFTAVSEVIGLDLGALAEASRIPILRAQVLGFEGAPIIQMAYLQDGRPYALCITRGDGTARPVTETELEGLSAATWSDGTHDYLLIGGAGAGPMGDDAAYFQSLML